MGICTGFLLKDGKLNTRKITSVASSLKTSKCDYKNLVEVKEYTADGELDNTLYFMKGLGVVKETDGGFYVVDLTAATLK